MRGSHLYVSLAGSFPFSLLWSTLLTCSGHASVTATSPSFLKVFGLPILFSLNYLANWYQESSQVRWRACHVWFVFGMLSHCLLYLFSSFCCFYHAIHVIHPSSSRRCPLSGAIQAYPTRLCSHTFSVGLNPETSMAVVLGSCWCLQRPRRFGQRELFLPCARKSLICVTCWVFSFLLALADCLHVAVAPAWLLHNLRR